MNTTKLWQVHHVEHCPQCTKERSKYVIPVHSRMEGDELIWECMLISRGPQCLAPNGDIKVYQSDIPEVLRQNSHINVADLMDFPDEELVDCRCHVRTHIKHRILEGIEECNHIELELQEEIREATFPNQNERPINPADFF